MVDRGGTERKVAGAFTRCGWARTPLSIAYHDTEWGVPVHDDVALFELLTLEGAQAGSSWETILTKREAYREAFAGFDPERVARFSSARHEQAGRSTRPAAGHAPAGAAAARAAPAARRRADER